LRLGEHGLRKREAEEQIGEGPSES
jgi:hypothetical protein